MGVLLLGVVEVVVQLVGHQLSRPVSTHAPVLHWLFTGNSTFQPTGPGSGPSSDR